jgi:hypothetical protein
VTDLRGVRAAHEQEETPMSAPRLFSPARGDW